ncbi:MAG TPA: 16S rRNA (guanine(527)-N(7))-methyltransferase RsmG [Candidatus Limnocylindrales bacterium]
MTRSREPLPTRVEDLPELPPDYAAAVDDGLRVLGLTLMPGARAALDGHVGLLLAWTRAINLTAIRDPLAVARAHVLDSLAAAPLLRDRHADDLLDLGSGGGFPGLPLAIGLAARRTLLVDSIGKKARFLETVVEALGLAASVSVAGVRVEALAGLPGHREQWSAVVARAVARLDQLARLGLPLVRVGGVLVAWKRLPLDAELDAAQPAIQQLGGGPPELVACPIDGLEDHVLVFVPKFIPGPPPAPGNAVRRRPRPGLGDQGAGGQSRPTLRG